MSRLLSLVLLLSVVACSEQDDQQRQTPSPTPSASAATTDVVRVNVQVLQGSKPPQLSGTVNEAGMLQNLLVIQYMGQKLYPQTPPARYVILAAGATGPCYAPTETMEYIVLWCPQIHGLFMLSPQGAARENLHPDVVMTLLLRHYSYFLAAQHLSPTLFDGALVTCYFDRLVDELLQEKYISRAHAELYRELNLDNWPACRPLDSPAKTVPA